MLPAKWLDLASQRRPRLSGAPLLLLCWLALSLGGRLLVAGQAEAGEARIKLAVFYESRCPDSADFFENLEEAYKLMGEHLELDLVPFGKASLPAPGRMVCQHGPRECDGNRLLACIQKRVPVDLNLIKCINCLFQGSLGADKCVAQNLGSLNYQELLACKNGDESYEMMKVNEKRTGRLSYVPKITVNGEYSDSIKQETRYHLTKYLCGLLEDRPKGCKSLKEQQQS